MPKKFESGVKYYTVGQVEIFFPEDQVTCRMCPLFSTEYGTRRDYCRRTGEAIPLPDSMIGGMCPINFGNDNKEDEENADNL